MSLMKSPAIRRSPPRTVVRTASGTGLSGFPCLPVPLHCFCSARLDRPWHFRTRQYQANYLAVQEGTRQGTMKINP